MWSEISSTLSQYKKYFWAIAIIGFVIHFNGLFGAFVWDDIQQIQDNNLVHSVLNVVNFFLGSTFAGQNGGSLAGLYYRPLMTTSFAFIYTLFGNYSISGQHTFFFHLFQLCLHILNSMLIFYIFKKFLNEKLAFILSLIFLVHPINVESIAYISTLADPLFFIFGLTALILYENKGLTVKNTITVSFLILCSLFAKETGVLFGLLLICYYFLFEKKSPANLLKTLAITLVPLGIYWIMRFQVAHVEIIKLPNLTMMTATTSQRIFTMPAIILFYLKTFFFPKDLFIWQEWMVSTPDSNFYIPLMIDILFFALLIALGTWIWKTNKKLFSFFIFFTFWFVIGIGFHLQIIPLDMTVADHMFYFPMVGLLGIIGIALQTIKSPSHNLRKIGIYCAVAIIILLSIRTVVRNTNWQDPITLYGHDLQYEPNTGMENRLAGELVKAGKYQDAQKYFEDLYSRNPNVPQLISQLASVYESENNYQKEEDLYQRSLSYDITGDFYTAYAKLLLGEGKMQRAELVSNQGILKFPNVADLWVTNAIAEYKLGNKKLALKDAQKAKMLSSEPIIDQVYQAILNDNLN